MCVHAERFGAVRDNVQDQRRFSGRPCLRPATGVSTAAAMTSAAVTTTTAQTVAMTGPSRCTLPAWVPCKRFQVLFRSILLDKLTSLGCQNAEGRSSPFVTSTREGGPGGSTYKKLNNLKKSFQRGGWTTKSQKMKVPTTYYNLAPPKPTPLFIPCVTCLTPTLFLKVKSCT